MKKFLFTLSFSVLCASAAIAYDTVFVRPHEAVLIELKVDTEKFPELKGVEDGALWANPAGAYMTGAEMGLYRTPGKTYFFTGDASGSELNGYFWYQFAVVPSPGKWLIVRDTVVFVHVWERPDITSFTLNGRYDTGVRRGDSLVIGVETADSLDVGYMYLLNSINDSLFPVRDGYRIDWPLIDERHLFQGLSVVAANPYFRDTSAVLHVSFDPTGNIPFGSLRPPADVRAVRGCVYMEEGVRYAIYDVTGRIVASGVYAQPVQLPPGFYFVNGAKVAVN
jgi:hypothetical protein